MKRRLFIFAMAGVIAMASLTGCGSSFEDSDVVATVNDKEITADIANFYARYTQAQYETYFSAYLGDNMWSSEASEGITYEESVKESVLKELETMLLLEEHMEDYDVSLSDAEKQVVAEAARDFDEANELEAKEKVSGSSETAERILTLMAVQQKMTEAIQAEADTEVSDEEAAQKSMQYVLFGYESSDEDAEDEELSDEEKAEVKSQAESFLKEAKEAEDFSAYATEQGLTASTITFDEDSTSPAVELIEAADKLDEGETTDVIETDYGCYVARVTSLLDEAATESEKQSIIAERKSQLYTETCEKWLEEADIDVNNRVWKKIRFNDMSVTMKVQEQDPYADEIQTDDVADTDADTIDEDTTEDADTSENADEAEGEEEP